MTLVALAAMAAAPSIAQQSQREREQEAIFRGEQVAEAIKAYYRAQRRLRGGGGGGGDAFLPTDMDQLLEGIPQPGRTKKLQVLRTSAARDPLSAKGEWRLIHPRSPEITDFVRDLMVYTNNTPPTTTDPDMRQAQQLFAPIVVSVTGLGSSGSSGTGLSEDSTGPFIGVSSNSEHNSVLTYYGIDHHNGWVFTPLFR